MCPKPGNRNGENRKPKTETTSISIEGPFRWSYVALFCKVYAVDESDRVKKGAKKETSQAKNLGPCYIESPGKFVENLLEPIFYKLFY